MDADRFDTLTRSLSVAGSRRWALAAITGSLGLIRLTGPDDVAAAKSGKCKPKCGECQKCDKGDCERKNGKKKCKKGKCKAKANGTPCTNGSCQGGSCAVLPPPSPCTNGVKDGSETDVDCGGGTCPRCAIGKTCASRNDCASARCVVTTCAACVNNITDCGLDTDGTQCACRESAAGPRICTKSLCRFLPGGTCASCVAGEQCTVAGGGIECCLPCGA